MVMPVMVVVVVVMMAMMIMVMGMVVIVDFKLIRVAASAGITHSLFFSG